MKQNMRFVLPFKIYHIIYLKIRNLPTLGFFHEFANICWIFPSLQKKIRVLYHLSKSTTWSTSPLKRHYVSALSLLLISRSDTTSCGLTQFYLLTALSVYMASGFKNVRCEIPGNLISTLKLGDFDYFRTNCRHSKKIKISEFWTRIKKQFEIIIA